MPDYGQGVLPAEDAHGAGEQREEPPHYGGLAEPAGGEDSEKVLVREK